MDEELTRRADVVFVASQTFLASKAEARKIVHEAIRPDVWEYVEIGGWVGSMSLTTSEGSKGRGITEGLKPEGATPSLRDPQRQRCRLGSVWITRRMSPTSFRGPFKGHSSYHRLHRWY